MNVAMNVAMNQLVELRCRLMQRHWFGNRCLTKPLLVEQAGIAAGQWQFIKKAAVDLCLSKDQRMKPVKQATVNRLWYCPEPVQRALRG